MFRKILMAGLASTALASAPVLAGPGGGHGHGGDGHANASANEHAGGGGAAGLGSSGGPSDTALDARMNSMGPSNASPTGIDHANPNSVLGTNATGTTTRGNSAQMDHMFPGTTPSTHVKTGSLSGLSTGMTLTSNGSSVGTVQQIRTSADGTVRVVVVQGTNGQMYAIPANKLSLANGALTTSARLNGINGGSNTDTDRDTDADEGTGVENDNDTDTDEGGSRNVGTNPAVGVSQAPAHASTTGIAHANSHSVLAAGAVAGTALPGLNTGLTVQNANGTTLGTVSQVVTDTSGNIRSVIVTSPTGQTYRLTPTTLTMNGTTVVTSSTIGG